VTSPLVNQNFVVMSGLTKGLEHIGSRLAGAFRFFANRHLLEL
jgi:hypothetical protein